MGNIWCCTTPKLSAPMLYENPHHTLHTISESRVLQGRCNIKSWVAKKCNLPRGNLLLGGLCYSHRKILAAGGAMGLPQLLLHAACRSGCQGTPQVSRGKAVLLLYRSQVIAHLHMQTPHWHCATTPTTLIVIFLLWLIFKDSVGTFLCWATPVKWYMSLCFVPMERRGVQLGDWQDKPSVPDPIPLNKGCLSKEKETEPLTQLGTSSRCLRSARSIYPCFCLSHFCFYWSYIHIHTHMLFLTSKNKLVGFFFLLPTHYGEMMSYID